jgi:hypothetical protein
MTALQWLALALCLPVLALLLARLWRMARGDRHPRNVWSDEKPVALESEYAGPYIAEFKD